MDFDSSWCFHCQREIAPKRYLVPVNPPSVAPAPVPTPAPKQKRTANGGRRAGLVHGTGRVKPNGSLKRGDSPSKASIPAPAPAVKHRTVIDQGPLPLYCSDECRIAELAVSSSGFNPLMDIPPQSPPVPPVPHNSFSDDSARSSSLESASSTSTACSSTSSHPASTTPSGPVEQPDHVPPSLATLARYYNFKKPIPPPFPIREPPKLEPLPEFNGGIIMAGRRMAEMCAKPVKKTVYGPADFSEPAPRKPIPGWEDGSSEWRASLYSFAGPSKPGQRSSSYDDVNGAKAFSHRSRSMPSTATSAPVAPQPQSMPTYTRETTALYEQFSASLARREESRITVANPLPKGAKAERPLLGPGLEGKLLVPNVKMPVYTGSSPSLTARRKSQNATAPKRPVVELRSWSYDNIQTYPTMPVPPKKEKRIVIEEVDGEIVERQIEVEVADPRKKLFNFPPKEVIVYR